MRILKPQKPVTIIKNDSLSSRLIILALLIFIPIYSIAQGIPKAYEPVNYSGKVNGQTVRFILANGYIGASSIKMYTSGQKKPLVFEPESGVADEQNRLKFIAASKKNLIYFTLDNMQDGYDEDPASVVGSCFFNGKKVPVKFWHMSSRKR